MALPADKFDGSPFVAFSKKSILLVEDEVMIRIMVAQELRDAGYHVIEAKCADEALGVVQSEAEIDLIVTDVRMPGLMSGADLLRLAKNERPQLKLVVASGHAHEDKLGGCADAFFRKPFDLRRLIAEINTLLA